MLELTQNYKETNTQPFSVGDVVEYKAFSGWKRATVVSVEPTLKVRPVGGQSDCTIPLEAVRKIAPEIDLPSAKNEYSLSEENLLQLQREENQKYQRLFQNQTQYQSSERSRGDHAELNEMVGTMSLTPYTFFRAQQIANKGVQSAGNEPPGGLFPETIELSGIYRHKPKQIIRKRFEPDIILKPHSSNLTNKRMDLHDEVGASKTENVEPEHNIFTIIQDAKQSPAVLENALEEDAWDCVQARNSDKKTALMICAEQGKLNYVKVLIDYSADPKQIDPATGNNSLMISALHNQFDIFDHIVNYVPDMSVENKQGQTALDLTTQPELKAFIIRCGGASGSGTSS